MGATGCVAATRHPPVNHLQGAVEEAAGYVYAAFQVTHTHTHRSTKVILETSAAAVNRL